MKKMKEQLSSREEKETLRRLYSAAGAIKTSQQMEDFLKQILTHSEKLMLGRRV